LGYASWCWIDVREALGQRARTVTVDNRGAGRSDKPPGPYSIERFADDAACVILSLGVEAAHVVGHSMGGYIALTLASRHPHLVRSLTLVGTSGGGHQAEPVPQSTQDAWAVSADLSPEQFARRTMPLSFSRGWPKRHPERFEQLLAARLQFPTPSAAWKAQFAACERYLEQGIDPNTIHAPALVIHGSDDRIVPVENGRLLAQTLEQVEYLELAGVGHLPFLEDPQEFVEQLARKLGAQ
jgi:pimeloyl-ACP methyl ester carboxylesterase